MRRGILVVAPYLPWPADFGGALRIYHLVRQLALDHEVVLVAPATEGERDHALALGEICDITTVPAAWTPRQPPGRTKRASQVLSLGSTASFVERSTHSDQFQQVIDRLFLTRRIDLVQYEFPRMAVFRPSRQVPTVIDAIDIEHVLLERVARQSTSVVKRIFNQTEQRKLQRFELRAWRDATGCTATSEHDAAIIRDVVDTPVTVVPNGVDLAYFQPVGGRNTVPRPNHTVFTGAMRHQPNADGARWYVERVLPLIRLRLADATATIAGADPPADVARLAAGHVTVTGRVDDIRPYLREAAVAVVPLHSGGGTRLKILEAMATGVPVVSTTIGAEGLEVLHGRDILIADTPKAFADAVVTIATNTELARRLADAGSRLVHEKYGWESVASALVDAHDMAIERFQRHGG